MAEGSARSQREALWLFRERVYESFGRRRDALFDLLDALLVAGMVPSFVHLSLNGLFQRGWGSAYDALAAGEIDEAWLREIVGSYPLDDGAPLYAIDTSVWARCDAECSPERGYYHHPSRHSAGQPIVAGWSYSWLAQLSPSKDSWTAPLDVRRVPPRENPHGTAVAQIRDLVEGRVAPTSVPTCIFDGGYDPVRLARELGDLDGTRVAVLVRLRRDRCFYADPPVPTGPKVGRPGRHGAKLACRDPATWPTPTDELTVDDPQYGAVRVRAWAGLHAKTQNHPARGSGTTKPVVRGWLLLVEVSRLPTKTRAPQQLWLWWRGPGVPDLAVLWRAYVRRFDLEHTFRFCKQTLNWTTPRVRTPQQADRWTWLVLLAYTELRLARRIVADRRLPWEPTQRPARAALTPARVRQGFPELRAWLGTPATAPKPCGRSPGRPKGTRSGPAPRAPALKKAA